MQVKGISWLGTRTEHFDAQVRFYREVLGMEPRVLRSDFAMFVLPDGDVVEVFGPGDTGHTFMRGPVGGFEVGSVGQARTAMEAAQVEFIGETHTHGERAWAHFRAPDGNIYEIAGGK